jgi:hypothetical protein
MILASLMNPKLTDVIILEVEEEYFQAMILKDTSYIIARIFDELD